MLDFKKKLTSAEIWHDAMQKRLLQFVAKLENAQQTSRNKIRLESVTPTSAKVAFFSLQVSGGKCPLSYHFRVASEDGMSFRITPTSPKYDQTRKIEQEDYGLNALGGGNHLSGAFVHDLLDNYYRELGMMSLFDARTTYARREPPQPS